MFSFVLTYVREQNLWLINASSHVCSNSRHEGWCKYCATLEKELTNALAGASEAKEKWVNENSWVEDLSFKQTDQHFESRTVPIPEQDSRKRKYESLVSVNAK